MADWRALTVIVVVKLVLFPRAFSGAPINPTMNLKRTLTLLVILISACVTPGVAQIFWSNHSPAGISDDIWCVTYADGIFAAVTNQGNVLTSTDGLTWSSQTAAQGIWLVSITYGNGTWVVVGAGGIILVSSDLKTWTIAKSGTTNKLNGVLYNGSYYGAFFIAVGENGTILTSPDAQNWTAQVSHVAGFLHGITYDPDFPFTLVSGQNGVLLETTDGKTFTSVSSGTTQDLEAVYYQTESPRFVTAAVGSEGTVITNGDGFDWAFPWSNPAATNTTARFRGLTFGDDYFVTAGEEGTILTSPDGKTWTQRFSGESPSTLSTATLLGIAYSDKLQRFVVTGTGGTILVSGPAPSVFGNVSTRGYVSSTETFIGGFVIEGTAPRTVLIRSDGPVLRIFGVPGPLPDPVLTVFNNSGAVIATNTGWTTNTNPGTLSTAALEVGAFALPNPSPDSALLLTLPPGAYTAQVTSAKGNSGIVLFEAYTN